MPIRRRQVRVHLAFKNAVAAGDVGHVHDEIDKLTANGIETKGGQTIPADLLVCATGFSKSCDYLPEDDKAKLCDFGSTWYL